jgi:hypothetical protein
MKTEVTIKLRPIDVVELTTAAKTCGLTIEHFLAEMAECKAADLRTPAPVEEEVPA